MTPADIAATLARAHHTARNLLAGDTFCDECGGIADRPLRDAEAGLWLGSPPIFCSQACVDKRDEREQDADGLSC